MTSSILFGTGKKNTFGNFDSGRMNLWKVNIALGDIAKLKSVTEEQIKDNFSCEELFDILLFSECFQEVSSTNIHIIVVATGKCLPTFYLSNKKFAVTKYRFGLISFFNCS